jgi:hypothetical protein
LQRICGGWGKSKLKLNSAQLELELGLSLAKFKSKHVDSPLLFGDSDPSLTSQATLGGGMEGSEIKQLTASY